MREQLRFNNLPAQSGHLLGWWVLTGPSQANFLENALSTPKLDPEGWTSLRPCLSIAPGCNLSQRTLKRTQGVNSHKANTQGRGDKNMELEEYESKWSVRMIWLWFGEKFQKETILFQKKLPLPGSLKKPPVRLRCRQCKLLAECRRVEGSFGTEFRSYLFLVSFSQSETESLISHNF